LALVAGLLADVDRAAVGRASFARAVLERLVSEPSVEGSDAIDRCLQFAAGELSGLAADVRWLTHDGLRSLVMTFGDAPARRRVAFSGHVDVVPAAGEWSSPPFALTERDGELQGRGTCDMKGGVAGFVASLHALADADVLMRCGVELVLTGDEEVGSRRGMIALLQAGALTTPRAICGEPTGLDIFLGNRGLVWATITVHGRGGHAGQLEHLDDPVPMALEVIEAVRALPLLARDERFDPPTSSLAITQLSTDSQAPNIVPDAVAIGLDRRLLPGEDPETVLEEIEQAVARVVRAPYRHTIERQRAWPPYAIAADSEMACRARDAVRATGRAGALGMDSASNDSSWLDQHGIETVLLGPGDPAQAHCSDERLAPDQLADAVRIYARLGALTR
jgi:acetylornithine deacetylase/succinyl-diaminopimelate desuccinylase-like protein